MEIKFIKEYKGWPGMSVDYQATYDNGVTQRCTCSKDEWIAMETKEKLLASGVDKDLLEKFETAVKEVERTDAWMSNMGEDL